VFTLPKVLLADIKVDFAKAPSAQTEHYFVNVNDADPDVEEEVVVLELGVLEPQSLIRFFMLSTITVRINLKKRDPIGFSAKSIILTSNRYIEATQAMKLAEKKQRWPRKEIKRRSWNQGNKNWLSRRRFMFPGR
jgi:hypothetical protein